MTRNGSTPPATACASSNHAMGLAFQMIRSGMISHALVVVAFHRLWLEA